LIAAVEEQPAPRLTPRAIRTRGKLVQAARTVFEKRGYLGARVSDITKAAKVAHGTFYTYFPSKREVFLEVITNVANDLYAATHGPLDGPHSMAERIEHANRSYLTAYRQNAPIIALMEQAATFKGEDEFRQIRRDLRKAFVDRTERSMRTLRAAGKVDKSLDPHLTADALGSMVDNYAFVHFVLGESGDLEPAVKILTKLWINAIRLSE
jgi:AcrR family transcriptional regulator